LKTEGDDMDVLLGMLKGFHRWNFAQSDLLRPDRAIDRPGIPVTSRTMEARKMVLSLLWVVTLTAPLIALMLSAGCSALPRPISEARFVTTSPNTPAGELPADVSGQYWKREQSREIKVGPAWIVQIIERAGPLDEELHSGRRVAITEFSVEFVDVQLQNPFGHPTMINSDSTPMPAPTLPVQPGREPSAVGPGGQAPMSTGDQINMSQALQNVFEQYLRDNGLIIVPQKAVTACAGYTKLKPVPSVSSSWSLFIKPVTTETGVVLRTHTVAAPGLGVATRDAAALASAEAEIMRETAADVVMAVKLRVGTYHRKAALEPNSLIRWTTAQGPINLTAQRALLSNADVTDTSRLIPVSGRTEPVHHDQFVRSLEVMLPVFVGLAFPSFQSRMGHDDRFARMTAAAAP
jgi:hypothetical protein